MSPSSTANSADAKSLSTTASTPVEIPSSIVTGTPPPPTQMTTRPLSKSAAIAEDSRMRTGFGEGTTRLKPDPSGFVCHP